MSSTHFPGLCKLDANTLHRMFGHPNSIVLSKVCDLRGVPFSAKSLVFCEACSLGKLHQKPHVYVPTKTTRCFELVHSDLWGLSHVISMNGFRYYISFVDDFS